MTKKPAEYDPATGDSEDRKETASFYTTPGAAAMLTALSIGQDDVAGKRVRIADFACGSGILLKSAMDDARARGAARVEVYGADINPDAVAAARERCRDADKVDIRLMPIGTERPDGTITLGSLDLIRGPRGDEMADEDWPFGPEPARQTALGDDGDN